MRSAPGGEGDDQSPGRLVTTPRDRRVALPTRMAFINGMGDGDRPYRFYGAEISYFSAKVRPALRYKGLRYAELPPDYRNVILPRTGLAFIPILVTPEDETLQDTSDILDALERRAPTPPLYPTSAVQRVVAFLWELYADEFMLLPAMHYRWDFPESERRIRGDFFVMTGDTKAATDFAGRMKGSLPFLGVTPETAPVIEAHTTELLALLSTHLSGGGYLLGQRMSLADCALMGPLYAHLYLDAASGLMLRETAPQVCLWIQRMNHPEPNTPGTWLADDGLAPTHRPLLELIGRDAAPLILDTVRAFETWADGREACTDEPPRGVGEHTTVLRGTPMTRYTSSYTLWMLQRVLDAYDALPAEGRTAVDRALATTGCDRLLDYTPRHRLEKRGFTLAFAGN